MKNKKCKQCGVETANPKFCSRSCAASFNNKNVRRHGNKPHPCELDGCNVLVPSYNRTCSKEHHHRLIYLEYIEKWLSGQETGTTGKRWLKLSAHVNRYVHERAEEKCEICGQGDVWKGKPLTLEVDHIDGDYTNNSPENLRLLCPHCHSQTETYRGGNGRPEREKWRDKKRKSGASGRI